jgi:hypothetical protein
MPLALSRTGVVFKKCYINNAGDFNRLARNVYGLNCIDRLRPPFGHPHCPCMCRYGLRRGPGQTYSPRPRPMISFMISVVPPKMDWTRLSVQARPTAYSRM